MEYSKNKQETAQIKNISIIYFTRSLRENVLYIKFSKVFLMHNMHSEDSKLNAEFSNEFTEFYSLYGKQGYDYLVYVYI